MLVLVTLSSTIVATTVANEDLKQETRNNRQTNENNTVYLPLLAGINGGGVLYDELPSPGDADFVVARSWNRTNLTYFFENGSGDIVGDTERQAIRDAFILWRNASNLTFSEVQNAANADIIILWATGNHGDGNPFDNTNGVLAHAFFPPPGNFAGDTHFDEDENWTLDVRGNSNQPIDLVTVAAPEIGHALGLQHANVQGALMNPFYRRSQRILGADNPSNELLVTCSTDGVNWPGNTLMREESSSAAPAVVNFVR